MGRARTTPIRKLLDEADWVGGLARSLHPDTAEADDLVQDTWVAALQRPPASDRPPRAWLGAVLHNLTRMRWRSSARRTRRETAVARSRTRAHEGAPEPDDVVARMEMQRMLADAVLRLEEPWRSTVVMRYLDGLSSAEIARREGIPAATVRGRLKTALARLRVDLDGHHGGRRDVWLAALVPFLDLPSKPPAASVAAAHGTGKAAFAVSVLVLLGVIAVFVGMGSGTGAPPADGEPAAPAGEPTDDDPAPEEPPRPEVDPPIEAPDEPDEPLRGDPFDTVPGGISARDVDAPSGMVHVPAGTAVIGTTWDRLLGTVLRGRSTQVAKDFDYEAPQHMVEMGGFFLDQHEVTNAQYLLFMQDTALASFDTSKATLGSLEEVAGHLLGMPRDVWAKDDIAWRQLFRANRAKLHAAMPEVIVRNEAGDVDEKATEEAFHSAPLKRDIVLDFYSRKPPQTWPDMGPRASDLDRPVTSVSYDDAERFAEWAGKHVPTEQEWEYAARGPKGFFFPWGNEWFNDLSHANWGGKNTDEQFNPRSMPVDSLPEGRSWCGAFHMLGNAAEWTSSWFQPYPGNDREHRFMGEYVKVIRGGTYVDLEAVVLRLAARNFLGAGVKAPPRPGNRFGYVGFRCAWYAEAGRSRLGPIVRRVSRGRRVTESKLALDRYAAAAATRFAAPDTEVENHVYVEGRSHAVVLVPLRAMLRLDQRKPEIRSLETLEKASRESENPLPLAVLHIDVGLRDVYVRAPKEPDRDDRRRPRAPAVVRGAIPAGTYVLGYWHERLCLADSSLEFVCFLTKDDAGRRWIGVEPIEAEDCPPSRIAVDASLDFVNVGFAVPVGGAGPGRRVTAVVPGVTLTLQKGSARAAGAWGIWPK